MGGHGAVEVQSQYGRGAVEVRLWNSRGAVEVRFRFASGSVRFVNFLTGDTVWSHTHYSDSDNDKYNICISSKRKEGQVRLPSTWTKAQHCSRECTH